MTNEEVIKSALKYLIKMQIEEGSAGFAVDNDHDHDCWWDKNGGNMNKLFEIVLIALVCPLVLPMIEEGEDADSN